MKFFTGVFDLGSIFEKNSSRGVRRRFSLSERETSKETKPQNNYSAEELRKAAEEVRCREEAEKREQIKKESARAFLERQRQEQQKEKDKKGWATEERKRLTFFQRLDQSKKASRQRD